MVFVGFHFRPPLIILVSGLLVAVTTTCFYTIWNNNASGLHRKPTSGLPERLNKSLALGALSRQNFVLYVRTFHKRQYFYDKLLVQSLRYFWPVKDVPLIVELDEESKQDHVFGKDIASRYPFPRVIYEKPVQTQIYHDNGHFRQQRRMFYAEKFTNAKYVGFIDTDTFFVTPVTDDILFENGKPIIIGQYGRASDFFWSGVGEGTEIMFKEPEVMRCMSYFPVIIKVEHLVLLRKHVENLHQQSFDNVFSKSSEKYFSQFNMMCHYIWKHHREEYSFHLQLRVNDGKWNGEGNSHYREPYEYYKNIITQSLTRPVVRSSVHYRYHTYFEKLITYRQTLKEGLCHAGGFELCKESCKDFNATSIQRPLFQFEGSDWSWDERCMEAQREHNMIVKHTMNTDYKERLIKACGEVDTLDFDIKLGQKSK